MKGCSESADAVHDVVCVCMLESAASIRLRQPSLDARPKGKAGPIRAPAANKPLDDGAR